MRVLAAVAFAERAHRAQSRKYTGEPYIVHLLEVARIVASVETDDDVVIAALLHDAVEDTPTTLAAIGDEFGDRVAQLVAEVTDVSRPEHGNRAARKALDREHLAAASPHGKTIKLADIISNIQSITRDDPGFARIYMAETKTLLAALEGGNPTLYDRACSLVESWEKSRRTGRGLAAGDDRIATSRE